MLLGNYLKVRVAKFLFGLFQEEISVITAVLNSSFRFGERRMVNGKPGNEACWSCLYISEQTIKPV